MTRAHKNAGRGFKGLLCVLLLMHLEAFHSECGQNRERVEHFPFIFTSCEPTAICPPHSSVLRHVLLQWE